MSIQIYKTTLVVRTEIKTNAKTAFKALQTASPKKVLKHENTSRLPENPNKTGIKLRL